MNKPPPDDPLLLQLRQLIAGQFRFSPGQVNALAPEEPLIGGSLGLDSLDAIELGMSVEEKFGLTIANAADSHTAFTSLASLAEFIRRQELGAPVGQRMSGAITRQPT